MPTLAFSTSWCSHRHTDGYLMAKELADLGLSRLELSHGTRISLVPGLLRAVEEKVISVVSTHNFCPLPPGFSVSAPNLFEPSSDDERELDQWLRHTRRSLEFADQVGAGVVICHLGRVPFFWFNPASRFRRYADDRPNVSPSEPAFAARREQTMARLRRQLPEYWDRMLGSLRAIEEFARERGLRLGFENRERLDELPFDEDFDRLFVMLGAGTTGGYWHDTGHAELKRRLGLVEPLVQLERQASRLLGFHLHDVNADNEDHQAVGSGNIDFSALRRFWRSGHLLVLELGPWVPVEGVLESKRRIEALLA
jgi:sugar phosphate isomerase/epimerase